MLPIGVDSRAERISIRSTGRERSFAGAPHRQRIVMLLLAADENFNNDILRGLLRRMPDLNVARVQDAGLSGADDPAVLEWAALEGRVLLTHDVSTITRHAYER